tara:strand:- start:696 stop:1283 length:588 start_codon:yes stop_codon:yes gene_type:complete
MYHSSYYINTDYDLNYDEHFDFLENIKKILYDKQTFWNFNNTNRAKNNFRKHIFNYIEYEFKELHEIYIETLKIFNNDFMKTKYIDYEKHNYFIHYFQKKHLKLFLFEISHSKFNYNFIKHLKIVQLLIENDIDLSLLNYLTYYKSYNFMNKIFQFFYVKYTNISIKKRDINKFINQLTLFMKYYFLKNYLKKIF